MIPDNVWPKNEEVKAGILQNHMFKKLITNFREFVIICIKSVHDIMLNEVMTDHVVVA
jgi:hypothetical protein